MCKFSSYSEAYKAYKEVGENTIDMDMFAEATCNYLDAINNNANSQYKKDSLERAKELCDKLNSQPCSSAFSPFNGLPALLIKDIEKELKKL